MGYPVEIEIKLAASAEMLLEHRSHPLLAGQSRTATLITTHSDTRDGRLWRARAALRTRQSGDSREQTFKLASPQGTFVQRSEWNVPLEREWPNPSGFPQAARAALTGILSGEPLQPLATTTIERTTRRLQSGDSTIEVAFDVGTITADGRTVAVSEIELELIAGRLADVISLARALPLGPELCWSTRGKADRAFALACGVPPAAAQALPVDMSQGMDVTTAFQAVGWNCLQQLLANHPLVVASGDPESVHQMRVAIRRLRAALSLFADVTSDGTAPVLGAELKAVGLTLGKVRDLQLLVEAGATEAGSADDPLAEMLAHLAMQRDKAVASAQALLASGPFQHLLFDLAAWLDGGEWLGLKQATGGNQPLLPFAADVLASRRRKLRRAGKHLTDLSDAERHRLRIKAKKLRYATTFFAALFTDNTRAAERKAFAKALRQMQDSLGALNDMALPAARREEIFADLDPVTAARHAAQLEVLLAAREKSRSALLKKAAKAFETIAECPAWWKAATP